MIRDETNPIIGGQLKVPTSEYDVESAIISPPSVDNSLYENNNNSGINNSINEETFMNSIDNADLLHCTEATTLLTYTPSTELIPYSQDMNLSQIFLNALEFATATTQVNQLASEIPERNVFPNLEEHDIGKLQFELNLDPNNRDRGKNYWYYSKILNKVFISLDKPFYITVVYLPKIQEQLYLRLMMVYIDDMGSPVSRCSNHLCIDKTDNPKEKHSVVRCGNNDVSYIGSVDGKYSEDRLALLLKLNFVQPTEENKNTFSKQAIQLNFVCQNSCIGRKQTALIFSLETRTQILGKKIVNVKICSAPKRDKQKDEQNFLLKRKAEDEVIPPGKRAAKIIKIKEEPGTHVPEIQPNSSSSLSQMMQSSALSQDMQLSPMTCIPGVRVAENGSVQLTYEMPNIRSTRKVVNIVFDIIAGEMANDPANAEKYKKYMKDIKKLGDSL